MAMPPIAARARTSLSIAGALGTVVGALILTQPSAERLSSDSYGDDGVRVEAKLASDKIMPGPMEHDVAITISTPVSEARVPVSLAIVIDRSGSMGGEPIANARAAAHRLVDQLSPRDAFSIVTYSSSAEEVSPIALATAEAKQRAHAAIDTIIDEGGTCISCGLDLATRELMSSPTAVRRMVLLSDGQANEGIWNRDELVEHARDIAVNDISITSIGVGLDFDEVTMKRIADVAHGRYQFAEHTETLDEVFSQELRAASSVIGTGAELVITDSPESQVFEVYGYPLQRRGNQVFVPIADLRAGQTQHLVVRVGVGKRSLGDFVPAKVELSWTRPDTHATRHAGTTPVVEVVDDVEVASASYHETTQLIIEAARVARAYDEAAQVYDSHGVEAARQVLERASILGDIALRRNTGVMLEQLQLATPAQAKKLLAKQAYDLTH